MEWIRKQYKAAKSERDSNGEFRILLIRTDECEIPPDFTDLRNSIDLHDCRLELGTAYALLFSLYYNEIKNEFEKQEIYVSRTWREGKEASLADYVCRILTSKGFRLIGDSKDQEGFSKKDGQERIRSIISSCEGLVSILPDRGEGTTSEQMIKEILIALDLRIPCLVITDPNVRLPDQIETQAIRLGERSAEVETILQKNISKHRDRM